jgi:hypothetical protein
MAVRRVKKKKFKNVNWRSGHIYTFKYHAWHNDPQPVIILMYALQGTHENTGHQWRFFQGINFTYIPRSMRRTFAKKWLREWDRSNGNLEFTWEKVKATYPWMKLAIRRYFFKPAYYINKPREIKREDILDVVTQTYTKDFSKLQKEKAARIIRLRKEARKLRGRGKPRRRR